MTLDVFYSGCCRTLGVLVRAWCAKRRVTLSCADSWLACRR